MADGRRDRVVRIVRAWTSLVLVVAIASVFWPASLGGKVTYVMVSGKSMQPGMHTGDLVVVRDTDDFEQGDAIAYEIPEGTIGHGSNVIHRIIGGDGEHGYTTQGDNRTSRDLWHPKTSDVLGERWLLVPDAGRLVARLRNPLPLGLLAAAITFAVLVMPWKRDERAPEALTP